MTTRHHLPVAREQGFAASLLPSAVHATNVGVNGAEKREEREFSEERDRDDDDERLLQVGDIAKATGKTVRAIHHYEDIGLLRPHMRSKGRYRLYDQAALTRVRWIGKLHDLGLSLNEIQSIVTTWESSPSAPGAMAQIRSVYQQKLEAVRDQIARMKDLEHELAASLAYLDTCDSCDPAELVNACTNCNLHDKSQAEPELVAGIHGGNGHCRSGAVYR